MDNPWLASHTIRHGHPGTKTPIATKLGWSFNHQIYLLTYLQGLPKAINIGKEEVEVIDYSQQAGTIELVYVAIIMVVVIFGGVGFALIREKFSGSS